MASLEFTGERFIPGQGGSQLAYEHLHRYLFALHWAGDRDVLDIATGAGYGASLLAGAARRIWALDLDAGALTHARAGCADRRVEFVQADAAHLPFGSATMGLVVAFEVIEHVADSESLMREAARVVQPGGVVLVSTPNRAVYSDARQYRNPYHVREFYPAEFMDLASRHFGQVRLATQQVRAGSFITPVDAHPGGAEVLARSLSEPDRPVGEAMYLLAICSSAVCPEIEPAGSVFLDLSDALLREWSEQMGHALREIEKLNQEIRNLGLWGRALEARNVELQGVIRDLQEEMALEIGARDQTIARQQGEYASLREEFEQRSRWALSLQGEVGQKDEHIRRIQAELDRVASHLMRIRHAVPYRVLCRLGILPR